MRYEYPLSPDSWVFDLGAHKGDFIDGIVSRYGCNVIGFEPLSEYYDLCQQRFSGNNKVRMVKSGMGGKLMYQVPVYRRGDGSGRFGDTSVESETCSITTMKDFMAQTGLQQVDLLKINIEGSEFEVLEHLLEWGLATRFKNIQVQFHYHILPGAQLRRETILKELSRTHELTWGEPWVWENFRLRDNIQPIQTTMTSLNEYFDHIICINLNRRPDRWQHAEAEFKKHNFTAMRFEGHDMPGWGNNGCTASHRGVLELISHHKWPRTLVLEDDFECVHDDMTAKFASMIGEVPADWEMLYLGGHYAEAPVERISGHVIRPGHLKTTSSYAVTYEAARKMAPHIFGIGPIDELYAKWNRELRCFIFQPRLMIQYNNYSDLQERECNNGPCMLDTRHENMV